MSSQVVAPYYLPVIASVLIYFLMLDADADGPDPLGLLTSGFWGYGPSLMVPSSEGEGPAVVGPWILADLAGWDSASALGKPLPNWLLKPPLVLVA